MPSVLIQKNARANSNGLETSNGDEPLSGELLRKMNAYWRAANYLSCGQIYLYDNPLLREPLKLAHVKPLVVGHWGTTPGQNFIYVHLNRSSRSMIWICFTSPVRVTAGRQLSAMSTSKAPGVRFIRTSPRTKLG